MMNTSQKLIALLSGAALLSVSTLAAQTATTDPVGYVTVGLLAGSDTYVTLPLAAAANSSGALDSSPVVTGTVSATLAYNGGWTNDEFAGSHFVRITSGARNGRYYSISSNTETALTIGLDGDDFAGVTTGDTFGVFKYSTLADVFPVGNSAIYQSSGNLSFQRETEVLLPDLETEGVNLAASNVFFLKSTGWVEATAGFPAADNVVIRPETYIVIRHPSDVSDSELVITGTVETKDVTVQLNTSASGSQDNFVSVPRPVGLSLNDLNLLQSGVFVASAGNLSFQRKDEVLLFDNSTAATNKAPSRIFFAVGSDWKEATAGFPIVTNDAILSSSGASLIVRKKATASGETAFWPNSATY
jgi:uncharacterized protein (TIGR02597 family)